MLTWSQSHTAYMASWMLPLSAFATVIFLVSQIRQKKSVRFLVSKTQVTPCQPGAAVSFGTGKTCS